MVEIIVDGGNRCTHKRPPTCHK